MGLVDGSVDSDVHSDDMIAIFNEIFGSDNDGNLDHLIPAPINGEAEDGFSSSDHLPTDEVTNLDCDLPSENLNASHKPIAENILKPHDSLPPMPAPINGEMDDVSLWDIFHENADFLDMISLHDLELMDLKAYHNTSIEEFKNLPSIELKAADESEVESKLKTSGVSVLLEAAEWELQMLDLKKPQTELKRMQMLDVKESQAKPKRKFTKLGVKPQKKARYNRKGINLRLSKWKFGI